MGYDKHQVAQEFTGGARVTTEASFNGCCSGRRTAF